MKQIFTYVITLAILLTSAPQAMGQFSSNNGNQNAAFASVQDQNGQEQKDGVHFHGNFPNPVKNKTHFKFEVDRQVQVFITVYDLLGNKVKEVTDNVYQPGTHKVSYDASDLDQGVYFYSFKAGDLKITKRLSKVSD